VFWWAALGSNACVVKAGVLPLSEALDEVDPKPGARHDFDTRATQNGAKPRQLLQEGIRRLT
jgi:hypothetical protein